MGRAVRRVARASSDRGPQVAGAGSQMPSGPRGKIMSQRNCDVTQPRRLADGSCLRLHAIGKLRRLRLPLPPVITDILYVAFRVVGVAGWAPPAVPLAIRDGLC